MKPFKNSKGGLDDILHKVEDKVKGDFRNFKDKVDESLKYLDERLEDVRDKTYYGLQKVKGGILEYGIAIKDKIEKLPEYLDKKLEEIKYKILEYGPKIMLSALPSPARVSISEGLYIMNADKSPRGKLIGYGLIIVGAGTSIVYFIMVGLNAIHSLPSNNEHVQYLGSGYIAFVPNGQTINYNGHIDPEGELILPNGSEIKNVIWDGQYSNTIIQNHNQIVQLNNQFVGQTDPINGQPYVPLQDLYVIDANNSQVPIQQAIINGQTYYVIEANNINPGNIAGFYTYDNWVSNFVEAMNTPGTYAAGLPGNSPVYDWTNTTGTVAYQTELYGHYGLGGGGLVLVQPNGTVISYGENINIPAGTYLSNFVAPQQVYNPSS
ncbi:hypothetical protein Nst1_037 [Candidatus Nanobsidianus stetteri]|uniref:Uncharacterized protein n=1 Tax=Nanobsidianus stetteri TaxID=1294122 RepID=R1E4U7_NANST|nr:hypothetical protein Nst1_037 [Candidatus Nanobsidianus stetteri]